VQKRIDTPKMTGGMGEKPSRFRIQNVRPKQKKVPVNEITRSSGETCLKSSSGNKPSALVTKIKELKIDGDEDEA
jgi:hypothetical protein